MSKDTKTPNMLAELKDDLEDLPTSKTDGNASFLRAARSGNVEKIIEHLKGNIDINTSNANGLNALHLAAKEGHVNVVTELLKRGANVNAATKKGNTALHIASLAGQEEVVRVLIQLGANVNVQSQNGFTPLYMAAQENHDSVVLFLLANGANQSLATEDGFTPLAVALQQGHDKVVAVLLENDTKGRVRLPALHIAAKKDDCNAATLLLQSDHNPDVTSKSGFTPLHIAAHYGNENIAKILLSKGADVNYAAKHQITPLHVASKWGKMNMVTLLLESGAQIESSTRDGLTPLHCAARSGHDQVVDLLLEKGAPFLAKTKNGLAPLHMASQGDHVDSARILLYHKAPVDDVTVDYLTALHVAAHCGHVKVAKLLLDRKADPNARALNGFTPLHIACKKNRIKVVELLLKHGASIEATTESGLTPLHVASFMGCMNIVIYLIQNGANPDVPTVRGETPLHLAARANQTDIIRILLRNGASVDARAREEQTPLHIAARLGNVDIVSLLLQHGAAVDAVTKDMYTALHIAAKEDQEEVASHLLDHGASLTSTTKKGFTPLHLAAKYGNIKVARLLIQKDAPVDAQGKNGVTPLHVAAHYDHVNVALLLLDKGASPHAMAKNGYTPLHIAAKKNQMDIASTLLEYGAKTNSESKAGFTPLHLSSQEGHAEMSNLLIDNKANVNHKANNGLTPLHLCAQDDRVNVATVLMKSGAEVGPQTKAGYTPLHVASHFGQINMVRFLLQNEADVHTTTSHGYTPLHQAAQQGHTLVVNYLLENQASPNVITTQGQTPLSIAQRLGYISVVETLKVVTETTVTTTTTTVTEEKYKVVAPETMQETFMTDSEDEGGADFDEAAIFGKPTHATHVYLPYVEGHNFHMSEEAMLGDQSYGYLTADEMKSLGDDSLPIDVTKDEKHHDLMHSVKQFGAPMVEEDKLSPQHGTPVEGGFSEKFSPDNIDLGQMPIHAGRFSWSDDYYYCSLPKGMLRSSGRLKWKTFLVSFMVDARGGAMRGCRHSGVRVIIPPRKASMPMRITCRYLRKEKLIHPPPLMEGEACASRILEMGPVGARFLGPVIIEVPHFASTRGKEREITILRSDTGETWKEHTLEASEEAVQEVLNESFEGEELSALEDLNTNRITRILTTDFPQYFAVVTRIRQEVHGVGPEGGMVSSTVVPQVQAIFPEGALTKKIRVGLQAQPIAPELVAKLLGNRVAVSPIVTVEPRRRKFHKPITLTIPVPQAATKGMINQYSGDAPTLRLLCSITGSTKSGGSSKAQWEDVTGSTPLTFVNDCVSFTTTVSARFWLMDCRQVNEVTRFATELYQEAVYVPFMSKFVIFAKRYDPYEAQLRVFCMTDDKEDKTLEHQEHFTEVAKSRDVEVLEGKLQYLEFAGNLAPVTKSGEQLKLAFQAFHENRLPFTIRVKDPHIESMGRIAFMKEPKAGRGEPPQIPICNLNVALPEITVTESSGRVLEMVTLEKRYDFIQESGLSKPELIHRADLRLSDIAQGLDKDWILLAQQLDMSESDIDQIKSDSSCEQSEQALMMLRLWLQKSGTKATGNELEKGLRKINREDIIKNCMFNVELVTDDVEKAVAKVHLDQSGFDVFKEELGSSREASMRRGASLDISYDEQDIMKEAESAAETSSETGSLFERDQISQALTDDKEVSHQLVETSNIPADEMDVIFPKCTVTSNGQTNAADSSDTVSGSFPIDVMPNGSSVAVPEDPSAMVHETSSIKIHDFWPAQPCTIVTEVPSSPEGQLSAPSESSTVPSISDQAVTVINQEIVLTDPQNKSIESNRIHVDTTDLGYCSLDKDPNMSPNSPGSDNIIIQQSVPSNLTQNGSQPILEPESKPQQLSSNGIVQQSDTSSLPQQTLEPQPNQELNSIVQQSVTSSLPQEMLEPESKPELSNENLGSETPSTVDLVTVTSTTTNDDSESPLCGKAAQVHQSSSAEIENVVDNVRTPGASLTNDESLVIGSDSNADACAPNLQDAKIRRASKTPPPTPVDELGKDGVDVKIKDNLFSPSSLKEKLKEDGLKETSETEIKSQEIAGRQEIPARLTESETWPSLELDTSQVSISSLPDDEKSEPTTATASDAVMMPTELDKVSTHVENVEKTEVDEHGVTTRIIQTVTTTVHSTPETVQLEEGGATLGSEPGSPELSFAEKRDFFQKLSLSSSANTTPTHAAKSSESMRSDTYVAEDAFVPEDGLDSPDEQPSFQECLKFFEKEEQQPVDLPKPVVKDVKKEVWTVLGAGDEDVERERDVETVEVLCETRRESVKDGVAFDSTKDAKVEVVVKTFVPGSEMLEICSVENIDDRDARTTGVQGMEIEALEAGDRSSSVVTTTRTVTSRSGTEIQRPEMEAEGDGSSAVMTEVTTKTVTTVIEKSGDGIEGSGTEGLRADAEEKKTGDGIDVRRTESVSEGLSTGGGVEGKSSTVTEVITRTVRTVVERTGDGDEMEKSESVTETSGLKDDQERKKTEGETDVKRIDSICEKLSTEYVSEDQSSAETEVTTPIFKTVVKRTKDEVGDSELVSHTRELRDDMAKGKTEDGTDAEITEFVSEIRPEDLEDDADEKSSTVTKVLTRTVTTVVKQTGDGTDVEESTVVKRTKDGTDVEESTVVKRTGDGTDVEESTIVKRTKDGTDVEESTVVKRTKDGTEIEESTVVKRTGDGTDVEESTVVKRTKDGTDVEESTIVKRTKDGTDVEESTVVKRTKDGTEVEESTVVKRTGDGTEVEESTVVKRTGDGTEIEKSLPETEDLKEDTYKKKTEERTEYLSEVIPQDEAVTKLSTVTKVVTRTVRTVVKRTGYGTEGEKTESIPETEVKSTEFVPGRPEDLGDEVEDESFRVTKVTTQRTVVERTGDGTEIEGTKFEPKTEELRHDTETEKDGSHVVKTEDIKDAEDKSSMVGTKVTTHTVRAVIKTTEDGSDSVSDIIEGVQDRPFVEMDDGIDIKTTELASEVKARDAEDKSSSVTTTVTTRTVTMTERTGEGSDEIGDGRDVTEVVKQTTRTEEDGTEVSEVIKSEEFRAKSIKTSKEEPEDVTKLVAEVTAKADGKDGSPIGEGKEKHESVTLTEQADDGTRVTETKVFEETEALKDDAEDGASTVITKVTTKTVTVTTTGEGTEFVPDITSKEMSFSKEDMAEIKETEDLGDYDKEKSSSETKIVSDIKTEDKEDDTDKSSIVTSKKTTEAITIAKQDGKEVTETKVAADEKGQELLSDEEFIKKTFRSMIESQPETCQVDVGGDKSTVDAFKKNGSDRSDWQRESPDNMTAVKETMAPSLGKSEIFICTESTLDNVKKILSAADAESNVVIRDGEASTSALESASAETTIEERREEADSKGSETPEKKEPEPEFFFCTKRVSSEVKKILSEVDEANESLLAKGEAPEVEAEPRVATSRIPTTVISTRVLHTTVESTSSMRSDAVEALKLDIERSREVGIQFEEPFARSAGSTEESCFGSSVDIEFVPVLEVSGDITDAPPAAGHEALGTPCSFHHEGELVGEFEKAEVEGPEKVQKGTDEASEGPEKIQRKVEVFEKVHRETARSDEGLEGLERVLKVTDEEDTRKRTMMDKFLDSVTVPPLQRTEEWLDRSSEAMREGVVVEEARAKRSSPTSFDEMARVDTDVVMQLLDLVEVRTEDEAPDIEEDISPSAEEEEEEVEGLMKIEEEPSCETSPSNTVVSRRGVRPQSSLEVEVGSREDEEAREDPIPLSLVEEEMREKMSLVEEEPPVPLSLVKDVREKVSEVVHETKEKVSSVKEEPHAPLSLVKDVREKVSEVVHETKEKVSSVDEESREMSLVEEEVPVPLSLVKDVKEKVSEVVHETKEKVSLVEEEPPAPFSLVKDVREKVSVHETKEKVSLVEEEPPVPLSLVKDVKEKVSEVVHETKEKVSSVKEEPETSSFGKEEQGSRAIEVQGLPISEQPAEVPKLDTETRPLVEETLSSAEAPMESKMATNASESGELETGVSKLPAETECKISVVTKTVEVVTGPETGASQERTKEEHDGDSKFVPCAFDNSAFAGAELIDQVEQSGPVRARSPYEVVRDDVEDVPCVTRQVEMIRRRPLLQNIPSEISEEDLVEREIVSPVSKQSFDLDVAQSFDLEGADVTSQTVTRITTVHPGSFDLEGADMGSRTETSTITTSGSHDLEGDLDVTTVAPGVTTTYRRDEDGTETKTSEHSTTEKVTTDSGYTVTRTVVTRVRQTVGRVPSSDDGSEEVGSDSQNGRSQIGEASVGGMKGDLEGAVPKSISAAMNGPGEVDYHPEYDDFEGDVKGRYGSVSDDVVDSEIRDIIQSSDQLLEDVIERPMTPEPPLDDLSRQGLDPFFDDDEEEHAVSSPVLSPEDPKEAPFAYGMQFEKDEAMDMDSDPYSEEKEHPPVYGYRYDMDEELPCYGDLYTHVEEDEETESRSSVPRNFDVLAGRKFFQSKEADEMSTSSLQEFERLEAEIVRGRKSSVGSVDSLNGGKAAKDDASLGSLNEFERLERECIIEGVDPQAVMQESVTQLSEIEEGHESQASDPLSNERKSSGKEDEEEKKQPPTKARKTASFEDDIDQDSLRDESSLKPDSLMEERREYVDSLKEEEDVDDSLQGDVLRDSLLEDRLDDSLHEMDVLPDESSLSMDGSLKFTRTVAREIIIADLPPRDVMVSSADSLEQMSAFHETSSFTGTVDSAMVSSTDTLGGGGRITFRYEDIPVDELEVLVKDGRRVVVDSEGNVQTEFDVRHFLDTEENFDFAEEGGFKSSSGSGGEEIVTTDEFGNRTVVRKIRKVVTTSTDNYGVEPHSKSSSVLSGSVLTSNVTEPEVEIVTTDEFGNRRIVRRTRKVVTMMDNYVVGDLKDLSTSVEDGGYISKSFADQECTEPEVEEIVTTDEFGNRKIVRKIRQFVTKTDNYVVEPHSKVLSSSGGEFTSGLMEVEGEPEMEEIVTTDEFGNKTIVRKSRKMVTTKSYVTDPHAKMTSGGEFTYKSMETDGEPEVEEIVTTDEFGNQKIVRRIRKIVTMTDDCVTEPPAMKISSSSVDGGKSFAADEGSEPEIEEIVTTDEFGNKKIIRKMKRIVTTRDTYLVGDSKEFSSSVEGSECVSRSEECDDEPEVEEIVTTDEFGNRKIVRKMRNIVTTTGNYASEAPAMKIMSASDEGGRFTPGDDPEMEETVTTDEFVNTKTVRKIRKIITATDPPDEGMAGGFDDEPVVEEIRTTDESGNPRVIRTIRRTVRTTVVGDDQQQQYSSSSSSVEEQMKEFLRREHCGGDGEEEVREERALDENGDLVLVRTVRQEAVSRPEVHFRTFGGPDAERLSREFVEGFRSEPGGEEEFEEEGVDGEGNVVRVTRQVVVRPEVRTVSFTGPDAHWQMEEYMRRAQHHPDTESSHDAVSGTQFVKTTVSSSYPEGSEQVVHSSYSVDDSGKPLESTDQTSSSTQ